MEDTKDLNGSEIAIIGMSGLFPGANNLDEFWENLKSGKESIQTLSDEELTSSGIDFGTLNDPNFVKVTSMPKDIEAFDADFFGMSRKEAEITDPQHRKFLELSWTALENAGYAASKFSGNIGIFAGSSLSTYLLNNILKNSLVLQNSNPIQLEVANSPDSLTTRVSYKMNLKGPSYSIQSACSSSLVAVHTACESLLGYESDIALAGGVSINLQNRYGYWYVKDGIVSPDGHCRAFDSNANGTVFGSGAGIVVLRRLEDAIRDGDNILAIIKGTAVNNDGSSKVGYTAPSLEGQADAITESLSNAGVSANSIQYVEAHGTGTKLGDPLEIRALIRAFKNSGWNPLNEKCIIGSVKINIGHLAHASGISGLIKTILSLQNKVIPPSIQYKEGNKEIRLEDSPFKVNKQVKEWKTKGLPRRAGVSSFGFGGTNAHIIVEEAKEYFQSSPSRQYQLLIQSAKDNQALINLKESIQPDVHNQQLDLSDICYTLSVGREEFPFRDVSLFKKEDNGLYKKVLNSSNYCSDEHSNKVVFVFGELSNFPLSNYYDIYRNEKKFQEVVDSCYKLIVNKFKLSIDSYLLNPENYKDVHTFIVNFSLISLLNFWGIDAEAIAIDNKLDKVSLALVWCVGKAKTLEESLKYLLEEQNVIDNISYEDVKTDLFRINDEVLYGQKQINNKSLPLLIQSQTEGNLLYIFNSNFKKNTNNNVLFDSYCIEPIDGKIIESIGEAWLSGYTVNWESFYRYEKRRRIPLSTYPFSKTKYWIEPEHTKKNLNIKEEKNENKDVRNWKDIQRIVNKIWERNLGLSKPNLDANFFELGGDSFIAIQVAKELREEFTIDLNVAELYEYLTIRLLTNYIDSKLLYTSKDSNEQETELVAPNNRRELMRIQRSRRKRGND